MSLKRCDRVDDVARLEWMSEDEARAFSTHAAECEDCSRATAILETSRSALRSVSRELSPEARVALRSGIDAHVEAEFRPKSAWLPLSITAATIVLAIALYVRVTEKKEELAAPALAEAVVQKTLPQPAPSHEPREPAVLRAGSRIPIEGGQLSIESDATLALALDGSAKSLRLIEGKIRVDVTNADDVFIIDTPKAELTAADGSLLVIAGRDELRVDVARGTVDIRTPDKTQRISAGESFEEPKHQEVALRPKKHRIKRSEPEPEPDRVEPDRVEPDRVEVAKTEPSPTPEIPHVERAQPLEQPPPAPPVVVRVEIEDPADLIARADRARRSSHYEAAAPLYRKVSEMPGPLAEEAGYLWADALAREGKNEDALEALRANEAKRGTGRLSPERTALRVRIMLALDRVEEAAGALEGASASASSVELQSARLAVAKAAVEDHPQLAKRLLAPLLPDWNARTVRVRALRIALLAARAEGDKENESALRAKLDRLED